MSARTLFRLRPGQAVAEMAMVLPVVLMLVAGIVEFGGAWRSAQVVTAAAREAVRVSSLPTGSDTDARTAAENVLRESALDPAQATIVLHTRIGTGTADTVEVRYPYNFHFMGPLVRLATHDSTAIPGTVTLGSSAVMRNE